MFRIFGIGRHTYSSTCLFLFSVSSVSFLMLIIFQKFLDFAHSTLFWLSSRCFDVSKVLDSNVSVISQYVILPALQFLSSY